MPNLKEVHLIIEEMSNFQFRLLVKDRLRMFTVGKVKLCVVKV